MRQPLPHRDREATVSSQTVRLVITADDLGIDPRRDDGIFAAHAAGAITQASLMVGGPSARDAAHRAQEAGLTLGHRLRDACSPQERIPTLLDGRGEARRRFAAGARAARGSRRRRPRAKRNSIVRCAHRPCVRHVDGHQHHCVPESRRAWRPSSNAGAYAAPCSTTGGRVTDSDASRIVEDIPRCADAYQLCACRRAVDPRVIGLDLLSGAVTVGSGQVTTHAFGKLRSARVSCRFVGSGTTNRSADRRRG